MKVLRPGDLGLASVRGAGDLGLGPVPGAGDLNAGGPGQAQGAGASLPGLIVTPGPESALLEGGGMATR